MVGAAVSLGLFGVVAVAVAVALTPAMEGGAIAASAWVSNTVDRWVQRLAARLSWGQPELGN